MIGMERIVIVVDRKSSDVKEKERNRGKKEGSEGGGKSGWE
jgi:hypothetical protein